MTGVMIRRSLTALLTVALVAWSAGCGEKSPDRDNAIKGLKADTAALQKRLADAGRDLGAARAEARQWKTKYEEASGAPATRGGTLPPDILKTFLEIAEAGGAWTLGPTGSIKASSDVLFASGAAKLSSEGEEAVKAIAAKLKEILTDERVMLRVDGHTDNTPIVHSKWEDNLHLSLMRARAVVKCLAEEGIPPNKMCAAGFGEWHPITSNDNPGAQRLNRRVELSLISISAPTVEPGE